LPRELQYTAALQLEKVSSLLYIYERLELGHINFQDG